MPFGGRVYAELGSTRGPSPETARGDYACLSSSATEVSTALSDRAHACVPGALLSLSAMAARRSSGHLPAPSGHEHTIGTARSRTDGLSPRRTLLTPDRRAPARMITGPVRPGRRTKLLVKHLPRGDIALVDHLDIVRVSAEELIGAGAVAVLNCRPSSSGSYPNLGPQLLVEAGILLIDLPDDSLFDAVSEGEQVTVLAGGASRAAGARPLGGEVLRGGELLARGEVLDLERVRAETEARRREIGDALERFAHNTIEHMREERELLAGRIELPRFGTDFRDRSTLVVVRGVGVQHDLRALRPFIRDMRPLLVAVDGGAEAVLEAGLTPDMIVGDMDSAGEAALRSASGRSGSRWAASK